MQDFDFIIVGAGSSGCVVANRLSAKPGVSVLLIEGGPRDTNPFIHMPRGNARLMADPKLTWAYNVGRAQGDNEGEWHVRGKVLGGSSAINGAVYMRGLPADYDEWNCPGWGWADMLRTFKAIEDYEGGANAWRGAGGELRISNHSHHQPLCDALLVAGAEMGTPTTNDLNAGEDHRMGYHAETIWKGRRQSSATAFLDPVKHRANLHIMTDTAVERLVFEGKRVAGVTIRRNGQVQTIKARREVVLSAGAIATPKLMQVSGIGPAAHLRGLGIDVVADAPEVGRNLAEHRMLFLNFAVSHGSDNQEFQGWRLYRNVLQAMFLRSGPLTRCVMEVGAYIRTRPGLPRPDARILMGAYAMDYSQPSRWEPRPTKESAVTCGGYQGCPRSRGSLLIQSVDPNAPATIIANYLADEEDRASAIGTVRYVRKLFTQSALAPYAPREIWPGPVVETDDEILDLLRSRGVGGLHITGTCRMGESPNAVVDLRLKVRGVEGLRVVDISVMPGQISGNTNAPALAIGHRAGEFILADHDLD